MNTKFQRRHYDAIAKLIADMRRDDIGNPIVWTKIKKRFGDMFIDDNPNFNPARFEEACEP
jgi:hypothetical protein